MPGTQPTADASLEEQFTADTCPNCDSQFSYREDSKNSKRLAGHTRIHKKCGVCRYRIVRTATTNAAGVYQDPTFEIVNEGQ